MNRMPLPPCLINQILPTINLGHPAYAPYHLQWQQASCKSLPNRPPPQSQYRQLTNITTHLVSLMNHPSATTILMTKTYHIMNPHFLQKLTKNNDSHPCHLLRIEPSLHYKLTIPRATHCIPLPFATLCATQTNLTTQKIGHSPSKNSPPSLQK